MINDNGDKHLLTVRELAKDLKVSINTIYYWVSRNEIPYIKLGKHNRFYLKEVLEYFKNKTNFQDHSQIPQSMLCK